MPYYVKTISAGSTAPEKERLSVKKDTHWTPNMEFNDKKSPLIVALKEAGYSNPSLHWEGKVHFGYEPIKYTVERTIFQYCEALMKYPEWAHDELRIKVNNQEKHISAIKGIRYDNKQEPMDPV